LNSHDFGFGSPGFGGDVSLLWFTRRALTFATVVDNPTRFARSRDVGAHLVLTLEVTGGEGAP
jgi:hypothetical protein